MKTLIGYILSGLGIVTLALSQDKVKNSLSISLLNSIPSKIIMAFGGVLIVAGVIVLIMANQSGSSSSKVKQAKEEVPIYEGEGKNRKIVGYRKG